MRINNPGYMNKMAAMPIQGKTVQISSSLELLNQLVSNLLVDSYNFIFFNAHK